MLLQVDILSGKCCLYKLLIETVEGSPRKIYRKMKTNKASILISITVYVMQ